MKIDGVLPGWVTSSRPHHTVYVVWNLFTVLPQGRVLRITVNPIAYEFYAANLNEDIKKCLDTYCNTNLYVSTTVFITQGNM